jgi:acyl-coenzyme A thioesterase PaaI-like protein
LHHGRTTSITRIEVRGPDGALCAFATATNLLYTAKR